MSRLIEYLSAAARDARLVSYSECMRASGVGDFGDLVGLLGEVQQIQDDLGCDLSALVISTSTGRPGRGWERGATEDWDSAVSRCFGTHAAGRDAAAADGESDVPRQGSAHGLPYDPGNAGDLLKHGWLAAVVPWLFSKHAGVFRYADPFAGKWDYELLQPVADRVSGLHSTLLGLYSESAWRDRRYLGSTGLVSAVAAYEHRPVEIWVGDQCCDRVQRLVVEHGCRELPCSSDGYAVLKSDQRYDLILLDPFAEFLDEAPELLPHIVTRSSSSSLLLFVLARSRTSYAYRRYVDVLRDQCKTHTATAIVGGIPALAHPSVGGESGHDSEVVFIPRRDLAGAATSEVLPHLAAAAVRTAAALGGEVEARLWMTGH